MAMDQPLSVQTKSLTIIREGVEVTMPLPPGGISWERAELLWSCVGVAAWTLKWTWWAANVFHTLVRGPGRW